MAQGYSFDSARFRLGTLCKRGHDWDNTGQSLRYNTGSARGCVECERAGAIARQEKARLTDPEWRTRRAAYVRSKRREQGRPEREQLRSQGLTTRGTVPIRQNGGVRMGERNEDLALESCLRGAIRNAGRMLSVAALVMREQRRYWRANPKAKAEHDRHWARVSWWLQYQTNPDLRLYHREKSKRRKAQNRGQTPVQIPVSAIRLRFNSFGNCCAYCGIAGEMELEHVVAISQGGAHDISNIVPACKRCNTSKRSQPMEQWYRAQPFFSELRLRRILRVTGNPSGQ